MLLPIARLRVEDRSMEPTLDSGDYVIVNRLAYLFKSPSEGDLVIIRHPNDSKFMVKRIESANNTDNYFVVGDNRKFSKDSRHFGPVKKHSIVGRVIMRVKQ